MMGITFSDHLIDSGHYDITPEQERETWAREECERRGIDPDEICADGGVTAWMVVSKEDRSFPSMVLRDALQYLHGENPNLTSGGIRNSALRSSIIAALALPLNAEGVDK